MHTILYISSSRIQSHTPAISLARELVEKYEGRINLTVVDVDEEPDRVQQDKIAELPCLAVLNTNGRTIFAGDLRAVRDKIEAAIA